MMCLAQGELHSLHGIGVVQVLDNLVALEHGCASVGVLDVGDLHHHATPFSLHCSSMQKNLRALDRTRESHYPHGFLSERKMSTCVTNEN